MDRLRIDSVERTAEAIHVLHVDDDPAFTDTAATILERKGDHISVRTATSPKDGLAMLADKAFDCIISEYELPGQTGIELLAAVRADYPELPFVLLTGNGSENVASDAMSAGATDYFRKERGTEQFERLAERITEVVDQYRDQRRAAETNERLRELIDTTSDILYMFNHDWSDCLFVNSAYEDIFGRSLDRLYEQPQDFLNGIHPDDRDRVVDAMETITAGESVDIEYRVNPDEDFGRWVEVRGEPVFDDDGSVVRVAGFVRDITKRKEHEQELQQTRDRMEFALESTDATVWDWNAETDEATFYPSEEPLYGTSVETLDDFMDVIHPDDRTQVRENLEESLETGVPKHDEFRIVTDSEVRWIEGPGKPVESDDETRIIGVARDITERKERERKLQRQNKRLEHFTSILSHDLRNPLDVASGNLELAREECQNEHLDSIERAFERIERLIDDALTLARTGDKIQETEPVSVTAASEQAWENVATADATLVTGAERTLEADPSRFMQLLENLFRNSVEHGGGGVTVSVGDIEDGFSVADDGSGIPEDERERIFDPGYSTAEDGTGLGLAIVREIVEAHGWEISVTDGDGSGTRFEITGIETAR